MSKKYLIHLAGINPFEIESKYSLEKQKVKNTTTLENLLTNVPDIVSFVDESKRLNKCSISITPPIRSYCCFWCRHPLHNPNYSGIGCPISYVPDTVTKTYLSEISHEHFSIKENVHTTKLKNFITTDDKRISIENKGYYETFGYFCSFNCCMSFIIDNVGHDVRFKNAKMLLLKIYAEYTGNINATIEPAPSWQLLAEYGGDLTIEKFRDSFNNIEYSDRGGYIKQVQIGTLFSKKLKF